MAGVFTLLTPQYTGYTAIVVGTSALRPFAALTGAQLGLLTIEGGPLRYSLVQSVTAHSASGHLASDTDKYNLLGASLFQAFTIISPASTGTALLSWGFQ